ncbi:hypothetical protein GJAV_G00274160 [Gymnothorax javanicus]|nr:hypothetical protein GJAV_G00274160 [Gymnothorax javanicus]
MCKKCSCAFGPPWHSTCSERHRKDCVFYSLMPIKLSDITESGGKIFKPLPEEMDSAKDGSFLIPPNGHIKFTIDQALHVITYSVDPDDTSTCKPENKLMDSTQLSPDQSYIFTKSGCVVAKPGELWVDEAGNDHMVTSY